MKRRDFAKTLAAAGMSAGLGGLMTQGCSSQKQTPVALQLYTVRSVASKDWVGAVTKVAEIGYDAVEFAGFGGLKAAEIKKLMDDLGLTVAGSHEGYQSMANDTQARIDFNLALGNTNLVVPSMPGEWRQDGEDSVKKFAESLNKIGEQVSAAGCQLSYHNHSFEFETKFGDKTMWDVLFENTQANTLKGELDVAWAKRGGFEPADVIRKYSDRVKMLHMKDAVIGEDYKLSPIGLGTIDMASIITAAREVGVEWFIVEQDRAERPILEAVEISLTNMRELLAA
jgi:sugar phosphate isomerase/epimerase